jgi:hypothetical protein
MATRETIHTPDGDIKRVVSDIDYMILCDGYQYGTITYSGIENTPIRRHRDASGEGIGDWELMPIGTVRDINKEGLLTICMSFARRIHGENPSDEECEELINKEWALLR